MPRRLRRRACNALPLVTQVEGEGYPELTARWWQWAMAAPVEPYLDPDGRLCAMNQDGPVWFLAGTRSVGCGKPEAHRINRE